MMVEIQPLPQQQRRRHLSVFIAAEQPRALAMQQQSDGTPIVFVIDDDPDVRAGLSDLLQSVGLRSKAFRSAAEFLEGKKPDEVSCLILDIRLPGLSGLDFQSELEKAKSAIPIIFITGHGDIPMTVKAMKAGAIEFLTKPVREQDLLDSIRVALDRDRARREADRRRSELYAKFAVLSNREREIMAFVVSGLMNKQVAAEVGLSEVTVKVHRHNVMKKLGARSLAELVRMADGLELAVRNTTPNRGR
jgi:FixJ family two-component response regulator